MNKAALLQQYLDGVRREPFRPGTHDCAIFFARWIRLLGGPDYVREWIGTYRTLEAGQEMLRERGFADHFDIVERELTAIHPSRAVTGDGARIESPEGPALGIVSGPNIFALGVHGLGVLPLLSASKAYRVDF